MDSVYGFYGFSVRILRIYTDTDLTRAYVGLLRGAGGGGEWAREWGRMWEWEISPYQIHISVNP